MRSSFSGVTFTPGQGVKVWSQGKVVRGRCAIVCVTGRCAKRTGHPGKHQSSLAAVDAQPRHLHESGEATTLCGVDRLYAVRSTHTPANSVHVTKARKSDCQDCRRIFRARIRDRAEAAAYFAAKQKAEQEVPLCAKAMGCLCAGHARGNPASEPCDTNEQPASHCECGAPRRPDGSFTCARG